MAELPSILRLPTEIRLQIYGYLYEPPEGQYPVEATFPIWGPAPIWLHRLEMRRGELYPACNSTKRSFWAILRVCKTIHQEVLDLLFERLLFTIFIANEENAWDTPSAPRLGTARDFTFWQRARRIVLVSTDLSIEPMKHLPRTLGQVMRCFKSTPQNTTTYLYMRDDIEYGHPPISKKRERDFKRVLKSLTSLSKRTAFDIEMRYEYRFMGREQVLALASATNASATFVKVGKDRLRVRGKVVQDTIISSERIERRETSDDLHSEDQKREQHVICWMSDTARRYARKTWAMKRKKV